MGGRLRYLALALAVLLMLGAVACDDDDDDGGDASPSATVDASTGDDGAGDDATADGDATGDDDTAGDDDAAGDDDDAGDDDGGGSAVGSEYQELFRNFATSEFVVTFDMTSTAGADSFEGEWTWYQDPDGPRSRFDIDATLDGEAQAVTLINTPEQSMFCSEGSCLEFPAGAGGAFPNPTEGMTGQVESLGDADLGSVRDAGTRSIAGVEAHCFEFDAPSDGVEAGTTCVSPEGVPLYAEWQSAEGSFLMEATAYSNSVSDEDFEAPFPVTSLGG